MTVRKLALPRRTFLRGAGVTLALPLLDAMVPALSAAAAPVRRLGVFYVPNGMHMQSFVPVGDGAAYELSPILRPLAAFRDRMVVVSGCSNLQVERDGLGAAPHTRCHAVWLNGVHPKRTEGSDIRAGITVDQIAAKAIGQDTQLTSLELALEPNYLVGNCSGGYSCAYINSTSWRTPTTPLPMENNPRAIFERLFGDGTSGSARVTQLRRQRSILDSVTAEMTRLTQKVSPTDRTVVGDYLEAVREVERRIQKSERYAEGATTSMQQPIGIPDTFQEHAKLLFDLQLLAYQADITRVITFQIGREQSERTYPEAGVDAAHHDISHMGSPERVALNVKINSYHLQTFTYLLEKMRTTADGDGSLLDHSLFVYGAGMGDGGLHSPRNLPVLLFGGASGRLQGGRHVRMPLDTPFMNVGVSVLNKLGVDIDKVGDSTGPIAGL